MGGPHCPLSSGNYLRELGIYRNTHDSLFLSLDNFFCGSQLHDGLYAGEWDRRTFEELLMLLHPRLSPIHPPVMRCSHTIQLLLVTKVWVLDSTPNLL